jgi:predicted nucleotidyltransferase
MTGTGLDSYTIQELLSVLVKFPSLESAVIYGSRARGNYRKGSDIDIALFGKDITFGELSRLDWELDDLLLPYKLDLLLFHELENEELRDHILQDGKLLYQRATDRVAVSGS